MFEQAVRDMVAERAWLNQTPRIRQAFMKYARQGSGMCLVMDMQEILHDERQKLTESDMELALDATAGAMESGGSL